MEFRTIGRYEHNGLGLPYPVVILNGAQELLDADSGVSSIHIPDQEGLAVSVALCRVMVPVELSGAEVRFVRRVIGMSAKDFAASLSMDPSTLSRWENDKVTVGQWADKQVRMAAVIALRDRAPHRPVNEQSVISMQPVRRELTGAPEMTIRRVAVEQEQGAGGGGVDEWDLASMPLAA